MRGEIQIKIDRQRWQNQGLSFCQKRGALASQLVPKLKESVPDVYFMFK